MRVPPHPLKNLILADQENRDLITPILNKDIVDELFLQDNLRQVERNWLETTSKVEQLNEIHGKRDREHDRRIQRWPGWGKYYTNAGAVEGFPEKSVFKKNLEDIRYLRNMAKKSMQKQKMDVNHIRQDPAPLMKDHEKQALLTYLPGTTNAHAPTQFTPLSKFNLLEDDAMNPRAFITNTFLNPRLF